MRSGQDSFARLRGAIPGTAAPGAMYSAGRQQACRGEVETNSAHERARRDPPPRPLGCFVQHPGRAESGYEIAVLCAWLGISRMVVGSVPCLAMPDPNAGRSGLVSARTAFRPGHRSGEPGRSREPQRAGHRVCTAPPAIARPYQSAPGLIASEIGCPTNGRGIGAVRDGLAGLPGQASPARQMFRPPVEDVNEIGRPCRPGRGPTGVRAARVAKVA